jgi:hypothetical protein
LGTSACTVANVFEASMLPALSTRMSAPASRYNAGSHVTPPLMEYSTDAMLSWFWI